VDADLIVKGEYPYWVLKYNSRKENVKAFLTTEIPKLIACGIAKRTEVNNIWTIERMAKKAATNAINAGLTVAWF
jgi:hypothetical protein